MSDDHLSKEEIDTLLSARVCRFHQFDHAKRS